jgi:hypothetical protein
MLRNISFTDESIFASPTSSSSSSSSRGMLLMALTHASAALNRSDGRFNFTDVSVGEFALPGTDRRFAGLSIFVLVVLVMIIYKSHLQQQ